MSKLAGQPGTNKRPSPYYSWTWNFPSAQDEKSLSLKQYTPLPQSTVEEAVKCIPELYVGDLCSWLDAVQCGSKLRTNVEQGFG